jgi:hypothetical protein
VWLNYICSSCSLDKLLFLCRWSLQLIPAPGAAGRRAMMSVPFPGSMECHPWRGTLTTLATIGCRDRDITYHIDPCKKRKGAGHFHLRMEPLSCDATLEWLATEGARIPHYVRPYDTHMGPETSQTWCRVAWRRSSVLAPFSYSRRSRQ